MSFRSACLITSLCGLVLVALASGAHGQRAPDDLVAAGPASDDLGEKLPLVPAGFVDELVESGLNQMVGFAFAPDGRVFFWQKQGKVYTRPPEGGPAELLFSIQEEVASWGSHGLVGFALDPAFQQNGYMYLFYGVDHHYLTTFGTPLILLLAWRQPLGPLGQPCEHRGLTGV